MMFKNIYLYAIYLFKYYNKRIYINEKYTQGNNIRYGYITGVKQGKLIVSVFDYGIYLNKLYPKEAIEL